MFVLVKHKTIRMEHISVSAPLLGRLLSSPTNIRVGWENVPRTNIQRDLFGPVVVDEGEKKIYHIAVRMKAKFVNHLDIAGAMVWSVDTDDFRGDFHDETFPLLRVKSGLRVGHERSDFAVQNLA